MGTTVPERTTRGRPGEGSVATAAGPPPGGQIPLDKGWEVPSQQAARKPPLPVGGKKAASPSRLSFLFPLR